jgi:uncharacterized protein YjbI with pentapeptide repeats
MTNHSTIMVTASLATLLPAFFLLPFARADIFEWEYIIPANPSQGKQPSTTLTPDGAGANAVPGTNLSNRNLTMAYLIGANLGPDEDDLGNYYVSDLTGANLSQADLTNASVWWAALTGANLTGAEVRGASFSRAYVYDNYLGGITPAQLYSTASYQAHDLAGIGLSGNNLAGVNLAGQNLTNARFSSRFVEFEFSYTNLTGANLSQANLTSADFSYTALSGANLSGAEVRGASFARADYYIPGGGITPAQLYSTASYQAQDLTGIGLYGNDLAGATLAGQNLTNAGFYGATLTNADLSQANLTNADFLYATLTNANLSQANLTHASFAVETGSAHMTAAANLTGANLSQANLTNSYFAGEDWCGENGCGTSPGADLTNANLSGADARGANFYAATLTGAITSNLIQSNGHITGLDLTAGASLVVRDYVGYGFGPIPIRVDNHLAMNATGTLRLVFDADPWDSTISFAPGIPMTLGGTLELTFAPGVNVATQSGRTIDLFDWTGVTPTGTFTVSSPYTWNLSNLYTTGEVTLTAVPSLPGDFNLDGSVDAADYVVWRKGVGVAPTPANYNLWRANFGQPSGSGAAGYPLGASAEPLSATVPEPASLAWCVSSFWAISTFAFRKPWRDQRHSPRRSRNIV